MHNDLAFPPHPQLLCHGILPLVDAVPISTPLSHRSHNRESVRQCILLRSNAPQSTPSIEQAPIRALLSLHHVVPPRAYPHTGTSSHALVCLLSWDPLWSFPTRTDSYYPLRYACNTLPKRAVASNTASWHNRATSSKSPTTPSPPLPKHQQIPRSRAHRAERLGLCFCFCREAGRQLRAADWLRGGQLDAVQLPMHVSGTSYSPLVAIWPLMLK